MNPTNSLGVAALKLAASVGPVHPLCWPTSERGCGCGWNHENKDVGKAPRTRHGPKEATSDPEVISRWWQDLPSANIGVALETARLLVIAPDSPKWLVEFERRGLPKTAFAESGGGEGHRHYYYRRPDSCLVGRLCRSGEYDIVADGYTVAPPSLHVSGRPYQWLSPPWEVLDLPDAPGWAVEMLVEAGSRRDSPNGIKSQDWTGWPPVSLHADALKLWRGDLVIDHADGARKQAGGITEIDRSATLYHIGLELAKAGVTPRSIAEALEERDAALGYDKYVDRPDPQEYYRIATKVFAQVAGNAKVVDGDANGLPTSRIRDPDIHPTDLGNAHRLVKRHGRDIRYCFPWRCWLVWDGRRWGRDETGAVYHKAKETVQSIHIEAGAIDDLEARKVLAKHALRSEAEERIRKMIELAKSETSIPVTPDELDSDPWLLNVLSGTLELRNGEVRCHRREDLITKLAPVEFDAGATCPVWESFLDRIMDGTKDKVEFLKRTSGYSLTGDISEEVMTIAHGTGDNGKTTMLKTLHGMMGDYAMKTPTETLMAKRDGSIPNDVARLKGARLVYASEAEQNRRLAEAAIKEMTSGDPVSARFMRGEWFEFLPQFKIWLATNHKPVIKGTDNAIWDRIRLMPFTVSIPHEEQDKHLFQKLVAEWPGILNWAVDGCLSWQRNGLNVPEEVSGATREYRTEMDILGGFIVDRCVVSESATASAKALYQEYLDWCGGSKSAAETQTSFGTALRERGFEKKRASSGPDKGRVIWRGIGRAFTERD